MGSLILPRGLALLSYQAGFARSAAESAAPSLWRGLMGAWSPMLGNTGGVLRDLSGRGHHGILTAMGDDDWRINERGYYNVFHDGSGAPDGNKRIELPNLGIVGNQLHIMALIRLTGANGTDVGRVLHQANTSTSDDLSLGVSESGGPPTVYVRIRTAGTGTVSRSTLLTVPTDTWAFIEGIYDGEQLWAALNLDYNSASRSTANGDLLNSGGGAAIGRHHGSDTRDFTGEIAFSAVYNRVLSRNEVTTIYHDSLAAFRPIPMLVSVSEEVGVTITPDPADATGDTLNPTVVAGSLSLTTTEADTAGDALNPTIIAGSLSLTPTETDAAGDTLNPTIIAGSLTLTTTPANAAGDALDPTTVLGSTVVTITLADAAGDTLDPTAVEGAITTTPADAAGDTLNPTVIAGSLALTTTQADSAGDTLDPTTVLGSTVVTTTLADATGDTLNPTTVLGSTGVTTTPADSAGDTLNPTIIAGSLTLTTTPANAVGDTLNPVVAVGAITTTPANAVGDTLNPTVILGSLSITTTPANVAGDTLAPSTLLGSITIAPTESDASGDTLNPSVILGAITTTPADTTGDTVDPFVVLGSIAIIPTPADAAGDTIDPSVITGAITTTPAGAAGDTVDPSVVLGSIAIIPTLADAAGDTIDPFVIATGNILVTPTPGDAVGDTVNPTLVVTILPTVLFSNLPRWIIASAATYFKAVSDGIVMNSPTLPIFVEGVDERDESKMQTDHAELRFTGPFIKELSNNCYRVEMALNLLITNQMSISGSGAYDIFDWTGAFQDSMLNPIPIYKYGDGPSDDESLIGCLRLKKSRNDMASVFNFGQISPTDRLRQAQIDGLFDMDLSV